RAAAGGPCSPWCRGWPARRDRTARRPRCPRRSGACEAGAPGCRRCASGSRPRSGCPWTSLGFSFFDDQRIDAVFVVHFAAGDRWIEDTDTGDVGLGAHLVTVVLVEQVQRAGFELVDLTGLLVLELTFAGGDEHGFDVVGVPEVVDRTGVDRGLVHRKADALLGQHDPLGSPV